MPFVFLGFSEDFTVLLLRALAHIVAAFLSLLSSSWRSCGAASDQMLGFPGIPRMSVCFPSPDAFMEFVLILRVLETPCVSIARLSNKYSVLQT